MPLEVQQTYARSTNILKTFQSQMGTAMTVLYQPSMVSPWDKTATLRFYGFISDLRMKVDINSLPESEIPNLGVGSSRTERITAVRDLEWRSPRKQIDFYMRNSYIGWTHLAAVSLLNRLPYYHINLLPYFSDNVAFPIASDSVLAAQITDAGYGLLEPGDAVSIFGAVREEALSIPTAAPEIVTSSDFEWSVGTNSMVLFPANPQRKQATIVNRSTSEWVYLSYSALAQVGKGLPLAPNGGAYEINFSNPYKGAITAIATGASDVSGIEAV